MAISAAESDLTIPVPQTGSAIVMNYARGVYAARPETIFDDLDIWVEAEVHDGEHVEEHQG